jgi:hypothetical protein
MLPTTTAANPKNHRKTTPNALIIKSAVASMNQSQPEIDDDRLIVEDGVELVEIDGVKWVGSGVEADKLELFVFPIVSASADFAIAQDVLE